MPGLLLIDFFEEELPAIGWGSEFAERLPACAGVEELFADAREVGGVREERSPVFFGGAEFLGVIIFEDFVLLPLPEALRDA